uniref:Uncharacterized protein n=1 Tax=Panagrellus redivivus TaxID=6233 RepID=A0A7E5A1P2_PANRE
MARERKSMTWQEPDRAPAKTRFFSGGERMGGNNNNNKTDSQNQLSEDKGFNSIKGDARYTKLHTRLY